jgi:fluoroquinolone transport system permease protein
VDRDARGVLGATPVTTPRRRVVGALLATGTVPRVVQWRPVLAGWLVAFAVLAWKADDAHDPTGRGALLRVVAVLLAATVVAVVDDGAAPLLAAVPVPLAWRRGLRLGLAVAAVAVPWAIALLWVRPGHSATLTLECAALTAFALAVASTVARWWDAGDAALAAGPIVLGAAIGAILLPPGLALFAAPGAGWSAAHLRWAAVLGVSAALLGLSLRDPARRGSSSVASRRRVRRRAAGRGWRLRTDRPWAGIRRPSSTR